MGRRLLSIFCVATVAFLGGCAPEVHKGRLLPGAEKVAGFEVVYLTRLPLPVSGHSTAGPVSSIDLDKMLSEASKAFEEQVRSGFRTLLEKDGLYRRISIAPSPEPLSNPFAVAQILQLPYADPYALIVVPASSNIYCGGFFGRACRIDITLATTLYDTRARQVRWTQRGGVVATPAYGARGDVIGEYWEMLSKQLRDDGLID